MELTSPPIPAPPRVFAAFVVCFSPRSPLSCASFSRQSHPSFFFATFFSACSPHCVPLPSLPILCVLIKNVILSLPVSFFFCAKQSPGEPLAELYNSHMALSKKKKKASRHGEYALRTLARTAWLFVIGTMWHARFRLRVHTSEQIFCS